ncbi:glycosyltransferase family 25 protein [Rhizobium sp. Leaf262]|uniref:glycosyltransferase family 25 protein n=1 Tax=Rhizobium sp. Leaf262 TaxID=1736312 RepID=UPI000714B02B|nr:glycosyltransferase family 25 protein [Rhizobium sp. Leaf262]KQO79783.1 glycosyl transferase family 25 [Rhizobium sp. Leaf262]
MSDKIATYIINLDRSSDRWSAISSQARCVGMHVERVIGVDGREVENEQRVGFDEKAFIRRNGRILLPGEYGCYKAHIRALELFLSSANTSAIIVEDDVDLDVNIIPRAMAIQKSLPTAEVVKLLSHRSKFFREMVVTEYGDRVGKCLHGPQGSAACYLVTRVGAARLLATIQRINFPYDIALERGWKTGVKIFTVQQNIVELSDRSHFSQIASREEYRAVKVKGLRKIITHLIRAVEYVRRIRYALS